MADKKGGRKGRKIGRNKAWCNAYRLSERRSRNKALKIARHLRHHPNNRTAVHAFGQLPERFQREARLRYLKEKGDET